MAKPACMKNTRYAEKSMKDESIAALLSTPPSLPHSTAAMRKHSRDDASALPTVKAVKGGRAGFTNFLRLGRQRKPFRNRIHQLLISPEKARRRKGERGRERMLQDTSFARARANTEEVCRYYFPGRVPTFFRDARCERFPTHRQPGRRGRHR